MRYAAAIFSLYLFCLALIPCGDARGELCWWPSTASCEHEETTSHAEDGEEDHCTPFCVCSCCSIVVDYPVELALHIKTPDRSSQLISPFIIQSAPAPEVYDIWQPPRRLF